MNKFENVDLVYTRINLDPFWKNCTYTLDTNLIEIEDKDGRKFLLTIEDAK